MLQEFTLLSDDEIEPEPSSDEETVEVAPSRAKNAKNKNGSRASTSKGRKDLGFSFDFDDGETLPERFGAPIDFHRNDKYEDGDLSADVDANCDEDIDDEDNEPDFEDNIRSMPKMEERMARAAERRAKTTGRRIAGGVHDNGDSEATVEGMDAETEAAYFDSVLESAGTDGKAQDTLQFSQLNLSRSLLRAVEAAGYISPTPVQAAVIPLALAGRDVCASAVTGSGKTAAFVLPFLERLLFRPRDVAAIRVLVVTPTRELATQIYSVLQKLSQFTDITCSLICGGKKDVKSQEAILRSRPDVVVCTPGRIIDHLRNSQSVTVDDLDVLVLDEVDRLLELGFQEEIEELLRHCPTNRQTLLFSATMTSKVEDLAKLSLRKPVRVKTNGGVTSLAPRLLQEFVKLRRDDEREREAILAALICRYFNERTIVFYEMKKDAHRFYAVLSLLGVRVCELHGNVSQVMRYSALQKFRDNEVDVMVCTDVAARGLDIPGVKTVLNAEMPRNASIYVHRVGRTARAGCGGRSVTLVSDGRRKIMKEVLKDKGNDGNSVGDNANLQSNTQVLSRTVPSAAIDHYLSKIAGLEGKITEMLEKERMRAKVEEAEREAERAENLMLHETEIASRPARTWYMSESQKKTIREEGRQRVVEEQEEGKEKTLPEGGSLSSLADRKQAALAKSDDYRMSLDAKGKERLHRLSRKKRRRLEAIQAAERQDDGGEGDNDESEKGRSHDSVRAIAKRSKVSQRNEKELKKERALGEPRSEKKRKSLDGKIIKAKRHRFAVGGLDGDMMGDWGEGGGGASKKLLKKAAREEKEFTEFDPEKRLRKGGKIGTKSFKSKAKFKRRK